jgi:ABC-2 type transport system permease protein
VIFGLQFVKTNLGIYPYKELNIAEIPYHGGAFYSSPNLILISEKEGWRADTSMKKEESYIYLSVITQLVRQLLMNHNEVANVQGADMLTIALPEAIALQSVQEKFGKEIVDLYLETKYNNYQKGRSNEANIEPPLLYADGSDYLEPNKGVIALYNLSEEIGNDLFNKAIKTYLNANPNRPIVFKAFYQQLLKFVPRNKKVETRKIFEKVE